ncbi:lisH domain-containing protein ARMC9 isoform X2 [Cephus cinctus]|uniref:LisH domain-containing protein ARMC9 isoform X2 n=1 Tax=Cephus cinctus TaxID=211228 RepID=A0AAJ7C1B5_CEPCN|nr:lisH domain-containing protein ARMC9 isoform X2 [Cephus cinctus]
MMSEPSEDIEDEEKKKQNKSSFGEFLSSVQANDWLIKLIHQFLLCNEFEITADNFVREATKLGFNIFGEHFFFKDAIPKESCKRILAEFHRGDWRDFFESWNNLIPENVRQTKEYKILTFKLHVHFAILPIRIVHFREDPRQKLNQFLDTKLLKVLEYEADNYKRGNEDGCINLKKYMMDSMGELRQYLETDGQEFRKETQLLTLFALPFLSDPHTDSVYSEIFNGAWMDDLMSNLQMFVMRYRQVQPVVLQNSSTEPLISFNEMKHIDLLNDGNMKDSDNAITEKETRKKLPTIKTTPPAIPLEISKTDISCFKQQDMTNLNLQIIGNDRNIPMFSDMHEIEEQLYFQSSLKHNNVHSKTAQTRISGIKTATNILLTSDLHQPANIINPASFGKLPKQSTQYNQELTVTKSYLHTVHCNYRKLKVRFHKLHADYHKLIGIAGELTAALENSVRGQAVDLQSMLASCIQIFPDLFSQNVRDNSEINSLEKSEEEIKENNLSNFPLPIVDATPISPRLLDFKKIKLHLISGNVKTKLLLLQALRWKVTLSQPGERDETIHEYITTDLLALHAQIASDSGKPILPCLLMPEDVAVPHPLQQSTARLLNALASLRCGRDYLSVGPTVLNVVIRCLNGTDNQRIDAFTCDMIIAMLQKLSLRKQQRIYMIESGLVEWLIYHLKSDNHKMGTYRLEYATALLMNLSLHRQAQIKISAIAPLLISTLTTLLSTDHMPALPYINGALNSFLLNHEINEEAKKTGLASVLEYHRKQNSGEIRKHLDHILRIHKRNYTDNTEDEETADDDNEELDVLEDELEEDDPVKVHTGELFGEALLASCYSMLPETLQTGSTTEDVSVPKTPKFHSRSASAKSPRRKEQTLDKESCDVNQIPIRDKGLSPRLTPMKLKVHKRNPINLKPGESFVQKVEQNLSIPLKGVPAIVNKEQQVSEPLGESKCTSVSQTKIDLLNDAKSNEESNTDSISQIEEYLNISSLTNTMSPYFFAFTRTYDHTDNTHESLRQKLGSSKSSETRDDVNPRKYERNEKIFDRRNFAVREANRDALRPSLSRERELESVGFNSGEEIEDNDVAVCLYAKQSSKESSETTLSSLGNVASVCESAVEGRTITVPT